MVSLEKRSKNSISTQSLPENRRGRTLSKYIHEASVTWLPKTNKDSARKKKTAKQYSHEYRCKIV